MQKYHVRTNKILFFITFYQYIFPLLHTLAKAQWYGPIPSDVVEDTRYLTTRPAYCDEGCVYEPCV